MSTQYLMTLCLMVTQLATLVDFWEKIIPIAFWSHGQVQTTGLYLSIVGLNLGQWFPLDDGSNSLNIYNPFEFCTRGAFMFLKHFLFRPIILLHCCWLNFHYINPLYKHVKINFAQGCILRTGHWSGPWAFC